MPVDTITTVIVTPAGVATCGQCGCTDFVRRPCPVREVRLFTCICCGASHEGEDGMGTAYPVEIGNGRVVFRS